MISVEFTVIACALDASKTAYSSLYNNVQENWENAVKTKDAGLLTLLLYEMKS